MTKIPFPQANNFDLLFSVLNDIGNDGLSKADVSARYEIDLRQGSYYLDALLYLGLAEKINSKYFLTQKGISVRLAPQDDMMDRFISVVLQHPFIGELYEQCNNMGRAEAISYTAGRLFNALGLSHSTAQRRANSIVSWFTRIKEYQD